MNASLPLDEIWKNAAPGVVVDKKLRCQFEVPASDEPASDPTPVPPVPVSNVKEADPTQPAVIDQTFISNNGT